MDVDGQKTIFCPLKGLITQEGQGTSVVGTLAIWQEPSRWICTEVMHIIIYFYFYFYFILFIIIIIYLFIIIIIIIIKINLQE